MISLPLAVSLLTAAQTRAEQRGDTIFADLIISHFPQEHRKNATVVVFAIRETSEREAIAVVTLDSTPSQRWDGMGQETGNYLYQPPSTFFHSLYVVKGGGTGGGCCHTTISLSSSQLLRTTK